ncbi:hypothetical protein ISS07_06345 [Candidatus Woesearchaeota archaeon]|nr:hypothetical protein [Candidatus Woesearchaeota archaeon]
MKIFYAISLILVLFVAACAQEVQQEEVIGSEDNSVQQPAKDSAEIRILGKAGFEPLESKVKAGSSVRWINDYEKDITLTIFNDKEWYVNSDAISPGASFEQAFDEPGEYEFWTIGFGPQGAKLIVG